MTSNDLPPDLLYIPYWNVLNIFYYWNSRFSQCSSTTGLSITSLGKRPPSKTFQYGESIRARKSLCIWRVLEYVSYQFMIHYNMYFYICTTLFGGPRRTCTYTPQIMSLTLYYLSYRPIKLAGRETWTLFFSLEGCHNTIYTIPAQKTLNCKRAYCKNLLYTKFSKMYNFIW